MPLELLRIDERLIHGQVLAGWGARLGIDFYVIVDDALAASPWEQEIWASALGEDGRAEFLTVEEAIALFDELDAREARGALLTRYTAPMRALAEAGRLEGRRVNVGGIHDGPGRRRYLDYVYLTPDERSDLETIAARGSVVAARDLPTAPAVPLEELDGQ